MPTGGGSSYAVTVFQNITNTYPQFFGMFKVLLVIFGFFLVAHSIWSSIQYHNGRNSGVRGGMTGVVAEFLIGGFIIDEELIMSALHNTLSGGAGGALTFNSILQYSTSAENCFSSNAANGIAGAIQLGLSQIGVIGTIMILYGFMQMRGGFLPGGDRRMVGKGLLHIIFGYVCADMDMFYGIFSNLFGLATTGCGTS